MLLLDLELRAPRGEFSVGYIEMDRAFLGVDGDGVAVMHEADHAAGRGLRRHFTDDEALVDETGKLAVGDECDIAAETRAVEREHHA